MKKINKKLKDREIKEAIMKAQSIIDGSINLDYFTVACGHIMTKTQAIAFARHEIKEWNKFLNDLEKRKKELSNKKKK